MAEPAIGRLMAVISRNVQAHFRVTLSDIGFNASYLQYLFVIRTYSGINQNRLAYILAVGKPSASKAVKYLRKKELIRCEQDDDDQRSNRLFVTDKGRRIAEVFKQKYMEMNAQLTRGFDDSEQALLKSMLIRMVQNTAADNADWLHVSDFLDE